MYWLGPLGKAAKLEVLWEGGMLVKEEGERQGKAKQAFRVWAGLPSLKGEGEGRRGGYKETQAMVQLKGSLSQTKGAQDCP